MSRGTACRRRPVDGLLCREADGADGRAFLVKFTDEGLEYLTRMHKCIAQVEREYERMVGANRMTEVFEALAAIAYADEVKGSRESRKRST